MFVLRFKLASIVLEWEKRSGWIVSSIEQPQMGYSTQTLVLLINQKYIGNIDPDTTIDLDMSGATHMLSWPNGKHLIMAFPF